MIAVPGYRLLEEIASGSSGIVYVAEQEKLGRRVAVKLFSPGLFGAAETRTRFVREARLHAKLRHPHVLEVLDAGFAGDRPFLVTELVGGGSLRGLLDRRGLLPRSEALQLAGQIAAGLAFVHDSGIVHRDLRPENVLLADGQEAKVADFGFARSVDGAGTIQTKAGCVLGTPGYVAPEVLLGEKATAAADIYALGVILFEMVAGKPPFQTEDTGKLLHQQMEEQAPRLSTVRSGVPEQLDRLVALCLEREPSARPASASALAAQLETAAKMGAPSRARPVSRIVQTTKPAMAVAARPRAGLAAAAIGVVLVLGAGLTLRQKPAAEVAHETPRQPPVAAPALPGVERVTTGSERVKMRLSAPAPAGLRFELSASGMGMLSGPVTVGGQEIEIAALVPSTRYRGHLVALGGRAALEFETLALPKDSDGVVLAGTKDRPHEFGVESSEAHVCVAWSRKKDPAGWAMEFRESQDFGATWSPVQTLYESTRVLSHPTIAAGPQGTAIGWTVKPMERGGDFETIIRHRPRGQRAWSAPIVAADGDDDGLVVVASPAGFEVIRSFRLQQLRFDAARGTLQVGASVVPEPQSVRRVALFATGAHRVLVTRRHEKEFATLFVSRKREGEPAWSGLVPVTHDRERPSEPGLASLADKLLLAYDNGSEACVRATSDTGLTWTEPIVPMPGGTLQKPVVIASYDGTAYLAYGTYPTLWDARANVLSSRDGSRWERCASASLTGWQPREMRLAAWRDRLLLLVCQREAGVLAVPMKIPRKPR